MSPFKLLALAVLSGCASNYSISQSNSDISTRDFAKCVESLDKPICYLNLSASSGHLYDSVVERLKGNPELFGQISLPNEGTTTQTDPDNSSTPWTEQVLLEPGRRARSAANEALSLDANGASPDVSIEPILLANSGVKSQSIYLGQITTESAEELRIREYERIFALYTALTSDKPTSSPSRAFVLEALSAWEKELSTPIRTFTDFSETRSLRELASNYAAMNETIAAKRVFSRTKMDSAQIDFEVAKASGDLDAAWAITVAEIQAASEESRLKSLNGLPKLAFEANDADLLDSIENDLSNEGFIDKVSQQALFGSLRYLNDASIARDPAP